MDPVVSVVVVGAGWDGCWKIRLCPGVSRRLWGRAVGCLRKQPWTFGSWLFSVDHRPELPVVRCEVGVFVVGVLICE